MKLKITTFFALVFLSLPLKIKAQQLKYYFSDSITFVDNALRPLKFSSSGGYHCPQFSSCDVNGDGKKDLVLYDKLDGSISTYINKGALGEVNYELDNRYADFFPKMRPFGWMLLRDYNNDGYEDIFTIGDQGYIVYKNISFTVSGRPAFVLIDKISFRNMSPKGSFIEFNTLSTPSIHLPGIYDIDNDGDLDIMSYSNVGGAIYLYKNAQVEKNLPPDSMRFFLVDLCLGYFLDFDCNGYIFNECKANSNRNYDLSRHTSGSAITLFDADNDGDIDMLLGNESCNHMTLLKNAKTFNSRGYDSFYNADTLFVTGNNRATVATYPAAYFLDIDNDGKRDLVYAPNSINFQYITKETNQINWFKNTGQDLSPVWAQQAPFFTPDVIDLGNRNSWAFADWDKDGDLDCIVANNGDKLNTRDTADRLYLFENIGTNKIAKFKLVNQDFGNFISQRLNNLTIAISDMDNDGKLDLVCGNDKGEILFYKNNSASNNTLNPTFAFSNNQFTGFNIDIGSFSSPAIADIDKDGLKDLVIGRFDSTLSYYRNIGSLSEPDFLISTNRFGNIKAFDSIGFQYIYDDTFAILGQFTVFEKNTYSKPTIADLNGDGILEIIVGNSQGNLRMYEINGKNPSSTFKQLDSFYYRKSFQGQKMFKIDIGSFATPTLADLDGDLVPEVIIGMNRGGLNYLKPSFKNSGNISVKNPFIQKAINGFPNPANQKIEFNINPLEINKLEVFNSLGQLITPPVDMSGEFIVINTADLNTGFYIVKFKTEQIIYTSKFQIIR